MMHFQAGSRDLRHRGRPEVENFQAPFLCAPQVIGLKQTPFIPWDWVVMQTGEEDTEKSLWEALVQQGRGDQEERDLKPGRP